MKSTAAVLEKRLSALPTGERDVHTFEVVEKLIFRKYYSDAQEALLKRIYELKDDRLIDEVARRLEFVISEVTNNGRTN